MELKIFTDGEPSELKPLTPPKQINENLNELSQYISTILYNVKMISFLDLYNKYGK
jgi:hypothetical protein